MPKRFTLFRHRVIFNLHSKLTFCWQRKIASTSWNMVFYHLNGLKVRSFVFSLNLNIRECKLQIVEQIITLNIRHNLFSVNILDKGVTCTPRCSKIHANIGGSSTGFGARIFKVSLCPASIFQTS